MVEALFSELALEGVGEVDDSNDDCTLAMAHEV